MGRLLSKERGGRQVAFSFVAASDEKVKMLLFIDCYFYQAA
jgi:hypothetical protein